MYRETKAGQPHVSLSPAKNKEAAPFQLELTDSYVWKEERVTGLLLLVPEKALAKIHL